MQFGGFFLTGGRRCDAISSCMSAFIQRRGHYIVQQSCRQIVSLSNNTPTSRTRSYRRSWRTKLSSAGRSPLQDDCVWEGKKEGVMVPARLAIHQSLPFCCSTVIPPSVTLTLAMTPGQGSGSGLSGRHSAIRSSISHWQLDTPASIAACASRTRPPTH